MQKLFARVRRWGRRQDGPAPPYEVVCPCGHAVRGVRQGRRQAVRCPACDRLVFVLACSPLPPPGADLAQKPPPPRGRLSAWRLPLIAAASTLAVLAVLFTVLLPRLGRPAPPPKEAARAPDARTLAESGRRALTEGDFHLAAQQLRAALDAAGGDAGAFSPAERRDLAQLERQGDLLSRLSSRSLEEIVQEANLVPNEDEWKAQFEADYRGRAVVFDDEVRFDDAPLPDGRRRPVLRFYRVVAAGREEVRLALEDLNVLQPLARERPRRMLFGGRLASVERGPGGRWVVRFEPDSGVLLTDRAAAEAVCPAPLDPERIDVLKGQGDWLRQQQPAD